MPVCPRCGIVMGPTKHPTQRIYCSEKCRRSVEQSRYWRKWVISHKSNQPNIIERCCACCNNAFNARVRQGPLPIYCSPKCRWSATHPSDVRRALAHERRARKRHATAEKLRLGEIFERDGWKCQICQRPVNRGLEYPSPMSASLDHILPLSRGGEHVSSNVQLAHLKCNLKKGRYGTAQLRFA